MKSEYDRHELRTHIDTKVNDIKILTEGRYYRGTITYKGRTFTGIGNSKESVRASLSMQMWNWEGNGRRG